MPGDPLASGRFWVEPGTGRIHQTEFWPQSATDTARVQVQYAPDEKLGVLLPRSASHTFETRERGTDIRGTRRRLFTRLNFESTATYANPRYTPIDLNGRDYDIYHLPFHIGEFGVQLQCQMVIANLRSSHPSVHCSCSCAWDCACRCTIA